MKAGRTEPERPCAVLAAVRLPNDDARQTTESLGELADLANTFGYEVAARLVQKRDAPDPGTYIGRGKLEQMGDLVRGHAAGLVIFDHDLSPVQSQNIERMLGCMVWDRTQVILEIFSRHARSAEARLQVELARLQYMLPRLVGMWAHLDRERGGIGTSRGMGEKQIQIDRSMVRARIARLQRELRRIETERRTQRKQRAQCFQVALVGYTNAGKSTLMNLLTGSSVYVADRLFATLDATTRTLRRVPGPDIVLTDTVGSIRNLPHALIASFRSTLDHVREADLLLHVIDCSRPGISEHLRTTDRVLNEIGAGGVARLIVFNKTDLCAHDQLDRILLEKKYPGCLCVSALQEDTRDILSEKIVACLYDQSISRTVRLPYSCCEALADFYAYSIVDSVDYRDDAVYVDCTISAPMRRHLNAYLSESKEQALYGMSR